MASKTKRNIVYDSTETEDDSSEDEIQPTKLKPEVKNSVHQKASNAPVISKSNNPKIHSAVSSIPVRPAGTAAKVVNKKPETSSEDETDSSDENGIQPSSQNKTFVNNTANGKASGSKSSVNIPKIHPSVKSIPFKVTAAKPQNGKIVTVSSEDESDLTSSDEDTNKAVVTKTHPKTENDKSKKVVVPNSSKTNNVKKVETSDETDSESDKTSTEEDDDASDEEEETDDDQKLPLQKTTAVSKKPAATAQPPPKTATFNFANDDSDEDYTSSEDEVFVKKPLTTKPFQTDSESEDPDYSDDSSGGNIPLKGNHSSKNMNSPKATNEAVVAAALPKPEARVTKPFQNPFASSYPIKATVPPQTTRPQQPPATVQPAEDNLLLNALKQFTLNLSNPEERQKELERRAEEALSRNELTFVCCVCMENFYRGGNFVKCKKLNGDKTKIDHYICITCLRGTATPENAGIASDGSGLKCPFPECPNILFMSEIHGMIDGGVESNLLELIGRMSLASADIGILVTCPKCQKQWIVEDKGKPSYVCECKRKNCLFCEREFDKFHEGRNCQEAADAAALETKTRKQNEVALEMNNIIVRVCHKCGLQFVKSDGCNKMTCRCQATQCYICRARDIDYGHFGGACTLYDNAEAYDQRRLDEVIAKNKNFPL